MTHQPRWVLIGDGESPHLAKWASALAAAGTHEIWAASSRGFSPGFEAWVPGERCLALAQPVRAAGGNWRGITSLPRLARWLARVDAQVLHAHYLSSHGTLAFLARHVAGLKGDLVASAWGSDILVAPERSLALKAMTRQVLRSALLSTSDSRYMAGRMQALGAREVMTFAFGLPSLPAARTEPKDPDLVYANRGLEPIYRPQAVLTWFAQFRQIRPRAQLVLANEGSLRMPMMSLAESLGLGEAVTWVGRIDAPAQVSWYERAQWYLSLPASDSVSVSVIEAMAHGCIPVLSDLPANRELVEGTEPVGGWIGADGDNLSGQQVERWLSRAADVARRNREWVAQHGLFEPAVARFLERVQQLQSQVA